jgi:hypothetical protein
MAFGMDAAGMRGHRHASPLTMRIMIAYPKASTRMRFRGDGMHMHGTSEVIAHHPLSHYRASLAFLFVITFCDTLSCFPDHACIPYFIPLFFSSRYSRSVSTSRIK